MLPNLLILFHAASLPAGIHTGLLPGEFNGCGKITLPGEVGACGFHHEVRGKDAEGTVRAAKLSRGCFNATVVIVAGEKSPLIAEAEKQNVKYVVLPDYADMRILNNAINGVKASISAAMTQATHSAAAASALAPALAK